MRKTILYLLLVLTVSNTVFLPHQVMGSLTSQKRVFYLSSSGTPVTPATPGTLTSNIPSGTCSSCSVNLTSNPIRFILNYPYALQSDLTVNGPLTLSFAINGIFSNSSLHAFVQGALSYQFAGVTTWTVAANSTEQVGLGLRNITLTPSISTTPLIRGSSLAIQVSAMSIPRNSTIQLLWGSNSAQSLAMISLSGYETLSPDTISVEGGSGNPPYFYLNAPFPTNVVVVSVCVLSALGINDVLGVNMTIQDPSQGLVRGASNETMRLLSPSPTCSFPFIATWSYSRNSTQGTYQIVVSIVDIQGNVAYTSASVQFGLVPPGYVPFPYNLIPYMIIGGIAASGGAAGGIVYRRRRGKSYLIPFDHFNNLTGGGLTGGTIVTVEGNTGSGKTLLLEQLMGEDLRSARHCVFVSTADFPNNVRTTMKTMGVDVTGYEQNELLTFVDGYSAEAGQESHEKVFIPSLGDLTTLGIKISSVLAPSFKGGSLYFDSLTPLASKARPESIVAFVQSVGAKVKGLSGKAFFTVGLGLDGTVQRQLEDMADCIVQMEAFEESGTRKRRLRITKLRAHKHQDSWALFTIEDGRGIIFYSKKPRR